MPTSPALGRGDERSYDPQGETPWKGVNEVTQKYVDLCDHLVNLGELQAGRNPNALHLFCLRQVLRSRTRACPRFGS